MADPLSVTAGIIAIVTATIQTTTALYNAIESFKSYPKRVAELKSQLQALTEVLRSLEELVRADSTTGAPLQNALTQCRIACQQFHQLIQTCKRKSKNGNPSFAEWMELKYRNGDIISFTESLAGYKSTIGIAIADANLRTSNVTLRVLNDYKSEVNGTMQYLKGHIEEIKSRLETLTPPADEDPPADSTSMDLIVQEKDSFESCLQFCRQFQNDLEKMQFQFVPQSRPSDPTSSRTPSRDITLARSITLSGLKVCSAEMAHTVSKLVLHEEKTKERLLAEPSQQFHQQAEAYELEVQRLQNELDGVNQLLNFCKDASSRATPDRVHVIEDIAVGDNSRQFCVSTVGDLFKIRGATAGDGSFQFFGSISGESILDLMKMHEEKQAAKRAAITNEVCSSSASGGSRAA